MMILLILVYSADPENPLPSDLAKKMGEPKSKKAKMANGSQKAKSVVDGSSPMKKNGAASAKSTDAKSGKGVATRSSPVKIPSQSANKKSQLQPIVRIRIYHLMSFVAENAKF